MLGKLKSDGPASLGKSKILVLEALLRLRQASCHPGLIDKRRASEASAKLDVLLPRLDEVRAEGHKALVFSQFTSFLAILRARLDAAKIPYQYLDGDVEDWAARVARFQDDPEQSALPHQLEGRRRGSEPHRRRLRLHPNPWWNPAVEAQAVDRAHRIGQGKRVFVYRLLCRDTVEEKVAALQESEARPRRIYYQCLAEPGARPRSRDVRDVALVNERDGAPPIPTTSERLRLTLTAWSIDRV